MDPRPLKYVAPTSSEEALAFAPEPVVIYDLPSGGGGGGGDVASVNGQTGTVVLDAADVGAAPTNHTQAISTVTGLQSVLDGKASTTDLDNTFGIATEAHDNADTALGLAQTAVQPAAIANLVPNTRTVAGKPLSANVSLDKIDVGLSNVDNISAANMPVSTAQQAALDAKVPTTRTVAGKALSANVTLVKGDVGLGSVENTADSAKPVSTAQQAALDLKAPLASPTFTGTVSGVTKSHVGLGNVDNTSDANKPVSTAQAAAINAKVGSPNSSVTGVAYYPTVEDLPGTGVAGVIYFVDAE